MLEAAAKIESFLLEARAWVSSRELCERFTINERALRAVGDHAGLCSGFAISGDKGFKHVACATEGEWKRFESRMRAHGIAELVRVKRLRLRRRNLLSTTQKSPMVFANGSESYSLH